MAKRNIILSVLSLIFSCFGVYPENKEEVHYTLAEIIRLADENSHQLKSSQFGIEKSLQAVKVARNNRLPVIESSFSGNFTGDQTLLSRNFSEASSIATPHWGNAFTLEVTQNIYQGGAITGAITLAELENQLAQLQHEQNIQELRFTLTDWYLCLYRFYNEEKIYISNKYQSEKLLDQMQARYDQGTALKSDVTRYRLHLKEIEIEIEKMQNKQAILNYYLLMVTGLPENITIIPDGSDLSGEITVPVKSGWHELVNQRSYQILTARQKVAIAHQQKILAKAEKYPSVFFWASESLKGPITTAMPPINQNLNSWQLGLGLRFTISSLYTVSRKIRAYENAWQQSRENQLWTVDKEQMAVNEAYLQWTESLNQLTIREEYKELADENYEVVSNRYLNGLAIVTEMLDASNEQLSAELNLLNKNIEIFYNYSKLKKLAGLL